MADTNGTTNGSTTPPRQPMEGGDKDQDMNQVKPTNATTELVASSGEKGGEHTEHSSLNDKDQPEAGNKNKEKKEEENDVIDRNNVDDSGNNGGEEEPGAQDDSKINKTDEEPNAGDEGTVEKKRSAKDDEPTETLERSKRARKSATSFTPEDFVHVERELPIIHGRGKRLGDLDPVRRSIESIPQHAEELFLAHRLLYGTRGKPPKKVVKGHILAFNGFLPEKRSKMSDKELEELDEEAEVKMGDRAYKLQVAQLKKLCDLFALYRQGKTDKDSIVDLLLDFLGSPDEKFLKGGKKSSEKQPGSVKKKLTKESHSGKKSPSSGKKSAKATVKHDDDDDEQEEDATEKTDVMPSEKQLKEWVNAYVKCFNMEKCNIKHALEVAGDKFGVDLTSKKGLLKEILTSAL